MTQTAETLTFVGQSVPRREDAALITGRVSPEKVWRAISEGGNTASTRQR